MTSISPSLRFAGYSLVVHLVKCFAFLYMYYTDGSSFR